MTLADIPTRPTGAAYAELVERFQPVFDRIAEGAVERESGRILALDAVELLRAAGFGTLRVPVEHGGLGAGLGDVFRLLISLGEADSNLPQLLRGHLAFLEGRRLAADPRLVSRWYPQIIDGTIFGNAQAERGPSSDTSTTVTAEGDGFRLSGTKYYSTGTLYADRIWATAKLGDDHVGVVVDARAEGVERIDDWDGFGQRLTASGTTVFRDVQVAAEDLVTFDRSDPRAHTFITIFYQLILLATLAGIARAAVRDGVAFVRGRTRTFGVPGQTEPTADPLVQSLLGRVSSSAFVAESVVGSLADDLERVRSADAGDDDWAALQIRVYQAQQVLVDLVLDVTSRVFEVGGASALSEERRLDRHWRNARTVASHNPAIRRAQTIGEYLLLGVTPAQKDARS